MSVTKSLTLISKNENMREILKRIDKIVPSDLSILLIGETGAGKEIFAEYIHKTSPRSEKPFVKISLSAMPADLLESELFGHEKGSFTSATNEKKGLFEIADGGSMFLDDIDDVPIRIQTKLLRVLESKEIMKIGSTTPIPIDVRVISASKVDLKELVNKNFFRADLFYRINVAPFNIPPLRERKDDILPLAEHFIKIFSNGKQLSFSKDAMRKLIEYDWPGNVRELKNVIQRVSLFAEKIVREEDLPKELRGDEPLQSLIKSCRRCFIEESLTYEQVISCLEHNLLSEALESFEGNQTKAAQSLGLSISTFRDKLKKYNLLNNGN